MMEEADRDHIVELRRKEDNPENEEVELRKRVSKDKEREEKIRKKAEEERHPGKIQPSEQERRGKSKLCDIL